MLDNGLKSPKKEIKELLMKNEKVVEQASRDKPRLRGGTQQQKLKIQHNFSKKRCASNIILI